MNGFSATRSDRTAIVTRPHRASAEIVRLAAELRELGGLLTGLPHRASRAELALRAATIAVLTETLRRCVRFESADIVRIVADLGRKIDSIRTLVAPARGAEPGRAGVLNMHELQSLMSQRQQMLGLVASMMQWRGEASVAVIRDVT